jgi:hypothetical protein
LSSSSVSRSSFLLSFSTRLARLLNSCFPFMAHSSCLALLNHRQLQTVIEYSSCLALLNHRQLQTVIEYSSCLALLNHRQLQTVIEYSSCLALLNHRQMQTVIEYSSCLVLLNHRHCKDHTEQHMPRPAQSQALKAVIRSSCLILLNYRQLQAVIEFISCLVLLNHRQLQSVIQHSSCLVLLNHRQLGQSYSTAYACSITGTEGSHTEHLMPRPTQSHALQGSYSTAHASSC